MGLLSRLWELAGGRPAARTRAARRFVPGSNALEGRTVPAILALSAQVAASEAVGASGTFVPVEVSGAFADVELDPRTGKATEGDDPGPKRASFRVMDPTRRHESTGPVTLSDRGNGEYSYEFTLYLDAGDAGPGRDGRLYYVLVTARDAEGSDGRTLPVRVSAGPGAAPRFDVTTSERAGQVDQHAVARSAMLAQAAALGETPTSPPIARRGFRRA